MSDFAPDSGAARLGAPSLSLEAAADRLDRALSLIEARMRILADRVRPDETVLLEQDRARMAQDLDESRAREAVLILAAKEAAAALALASSEVRRILAADTLEVIDAQIDDDAQIDPPAADMLGAGAEPQDETSLPGAEEPLQASLVAVGG